MDLKELAEACDWPLNQGFQFLDDPDEHKPCYVVLPGGAMLPLSHHGKNGVDQARARFIVDACNAALGNTVPLLISQEWLDRKVASEADAECEACTPPAIRGKPMSETKRPDASALATVERYLSDRFQWAAPGDQQEDAWLVRFCDKDCGEAVFTGPDAEREAWDYWNRYAPSYNLYVFRLAALAPAADDATVERVARQLYEAHHYAGPLDDQPIEWGRGGYKTEVATWRAVARAALRALGSQP